MMMLWLRSFLFNTLFWLWIVLLGLAGLPFALIYRPFSCTIARCWAKVTLWMLRVICHIHYEIRGKEYIPSQANIIASKHQSAWDTVIFWAVIAKPAYVLKRELLYLPVFGWYLLLLKSVYINRKAGASALKFMLRESQQRLKEQRPIVIFPEGTRSAPFTISTYHPGVAALYQHLHFSVTPVALNSGLYWQKNSFLKKPGTIIIEFLPEIAAGLKSREFLKTLESTIESATQQLLTKP